MSEQEQALAQAQAQGGIPAEAIDALVVTLDSAFQMAGPGVPEKVLAKGKEFIEALNEWSDEKRKAQ